MLCLTVAGFFMQKTYLCDIFCTLHLDVIKTSHKHALFDSSWIFYVENISLRHLLYVTSGCHKNVSQTSLLLQYTLYALQNNTTFRFCSLLYKVKENRNVVFFSNAKKQDHVLLLFVFVYCSIKKDRKQSWWPCLCLKSFAFPIVCFFLFVSFYENCSFLKRLRKAQNSVSA